MSKFLLMSNCVCRPMLCQKGFMHRLFPIIFICLLVFSALSYATQIPDSKQHLLSGTIKIKLSDQEKAFLDAHPVIRIGTDETWEPYVSRKQDGQLEGFDVDLIQHINEATGANIELVTGKWAAIVEKAKNHEIDGLCASAPLEARKPFFAFSQTYVTEYALFAVRAGSALEINKIEDLDGKTIAVQKGNEFYSALLKPFHNIKVIDADSEIECARIMIEGKADASITSTSTYFTLRKHYSQSIKVGYVASKNPLDVVYSIRKDWPELISIINKGLSSISTEKFVNIYYRWFRVEPYGSIGIAPKQLLSADEQSWLKEHAHIKIGVWTNVPPYAFLDDSGDPQGIFIDYIREIENRIEIPFDIVTVYSFSEAWEMAMRREVDILVAATPREENKNEMNFSQTYHVVPVVLVTRSDFPLVTSLKDLNGKKVVVGKGHVTEQGIKRDFPGIQLVLSEDYEKGLRLVSEGKADAYAGGMAAVIWQIREHRITNLKIAANTPYDYKLSVAVRKDWPEMLPILNKTLTSIQKEKKNSIYDRWVTIRFEKGVDWGLVWKIIGSVIAVSTMICLIIFFWNRRLRKEIFEKKKAEEALKESERQLSTLIGNLPGMAYRCRNDKDWTMLYISDGCEALTGYKSSELILNRIAVYGDLIVQGDRQNVWNEVQLALNENRPFTIEYRIIDRNATERWLWEKGTAQQEGENGPLILEGFISDISERKKMEIALRESERNLVEAQRITHIGSWVWDLSADILNCSEEMLKIFGFAQNNPIIAFQAFEERIDKKDFKDVKNALEKAIKGNGRYESEFRIVLPGGGQRIIHGVGRVIYDESSNPFLMRGSGQDITERVLAEKEKAALEAQLLQARKMESIGTLAGGVAHEFNNILGIILGNAELAIDDIPAWNPTYDFLLEVRNASLRGKDVVKQLLSFSRKSRDKRQPLDMVRVVNDSIKFLRISIPANIEFKVNIPEDCHPVMGDRTQIHQLMINLCNNAAQSMEDTGGILELTLENMTLKDRLCSFDQILMPGEYVRLTVSDTGHGIPEDILEHIFDPFFTTKDIDKGSGMGLAVVHGIIKGHDGFIKIENKPGKGSAFICYFRPTSFLPADVVDTTETLPTGGETILFVDDEASLVKMGQQLLERTGYAVETETDPSKALARFKADPAKFDLVITDMTMPQMTGDQLIKELIKIRADIKTIICTGYSRKINDQKAVRMGASGYIMKPVDRKILAKTVRRVLDQTKNN